MSLVIELYVEDIDDSIIPSWIKRMNDFDMSCEIHPEFSFKDHSGFLPFKIRLNKAFRYELLDKYFLTGFELYTSNFDFDVDFTKLQPETKKSLFEKLFGLKANKLSFVRPDLNIKLRKCKKIVYFVYGSSDIFEFRMATLSSAVLTDITNGVCHYTEENIWYENTTIISEAVESIAQYESLVKPEHIGFNEFEKWL